MKKILFLLLLFWFGKTYGQSAVSQNTKTDKVIMRNINNNVEIEFRQNKKTNLLVLLTDATGHTVFLDNRNNFSGNYKQKFEVAKKGEYFLKVIDDSGQFSKQFTIK
jgi:hypothetical protein